MPRLPYVSARWAVSTVALTLLVGIASCGDGGLAPDGVVRVALTGPNADALYVGDTIRLAATPLGVSGRMMMGRAVRYTSSDLAIATVDPTSGLVTAHAPGTVRISATCEGASGWMDLHVRLAPVASVAVTPDTRALHPQWTVQLAVALADVKGRPLTGRQIEFTSSDLNVATVGATGLVTAGGLGTATITASSEGRSDVVLITVTPAPVFAVTITPDERFMSDGTLRQYQAYARDERGFTLPDRPIVWESSDAAVAFVSQNGMVSARVPGGVMITARSGAVSASLPLTVRPHIEAIAVTPAKDTLRSGEFSSVEVHLSDALGNRLVDRDVTLWSSNPAVLAVLSDGRLRAMNVGTATVTARSEGRTATVAVVVIENVVFVRLTPSFVTLPKNSTFALTVSVLDGRGQELTGRVVTYESSNPNVATVDASGVVKGVAAGETMITATCEGRSGSAKITVP